MASILKSIELHKRSTLTKHSNMPDILTLDLIQNQETTIQQTKERLKGLNLNSKRSSSEERFKISKFYHGNIRFNTLIGHGTTITLAFIADEINNNTCINIERNEEEEQRKLYDLYTLAIMSGLKPNSATYIGKYDNGDFIFYIDTTKRIFFEFKPKIEFYKNR